jgi:Domain of unknown function (DUF6249)
MHQDPDINGILALSLPIVAIVLGIGLAALSVWTRYQHKRALFELHHKERLAAIERGIDVPPLPSEFFETAKTGKAIQSAERLRRGLVWTAAGLAWVAAQSLNEKPHQAAYGLIPIAIGVANLAYYFAVGRHLPPPQQTPQTPNDVR